MNPTQAIKIEKLTLNVGAGKDQTKLEKGISLLHQLTGIPPVKTITQKRIPAWGLRPGLPVGCRITLRGKAAEEMLVRLLKAKENIIRKSQVDQAGNLALGIPEYIDIPGAKYDPKIGIAGLQATVTLIRPGYRIKKRRIMPRPIPKKHQIGQDEAIEYFKKKFNVTIEG